MGREYLFVAAGLFSTVIASWQLWMVHSGQATGMLMYIMIGMNIFFAIYNLRNATRKV